MRLRHRKWGDEFLLENKNLIKDKDNLDQDFIDFINHDNLRLEIGVGRGDFIVQMALANPNVYFLGVEMSSMALAIAGKKIIENEIKNVLLINIDMHYLFEKIGENKFDIIYLNFSDPWPKKRQHKRGLTYPTCLNEYYKELKKDGKVIFKTDNDLLFEDSIPYFEESPLEIVSITRNYDVLDNDDKMTEYEKKFRGLNTPIKRLIAIKK